jgi:hypothetical protein
LVVSDEPLVPYWVVIVVGALGRAAALVPLPG